MTAYRLTPLAQADIDGIFDYTLKTWGLRQAKTDARQIQGALETIAERPLLGRSCDALRTGYRMYPAGAHVIFYRVDPDAVDVIRILHGRMDFARHL